MPEWWNGSHSRLKICRLYGREGSSPSSGTFNFIEVLMSNPLNIDFSSFFKKDPKFNPERDPESGKPIPKEVIKAPESDLIFTSVNEIKSDSSLGTILKNIQDELAPDDPFSEYEVPPIHEYKLKGKKVYFTHFKNDKDEYVLMTCLIKQTKNRGQTVLNQGEVDAFMKSHSDKGLDGTMTIEQFNTHYKSDCVEVDVDFGVGDDDFSDQNMRIIREE